MNEGIIQTVRDIMKKNDLSTYRVARDIDSNQSNVSRLLNAKSGKTPVLWQRVFDYLNLELMAIPVDRIEDVRQLLESANDSNNSI